MPPKKPYEEVDQDPKPDVKPIDTKPFRKPDNGFRPPPRRSFIDRIPFIRRFNGNFNRNENRDGIIRRVYNRIINNRENRFFPLNEEITRQKRWDIGCGPKLAISPTYDLPIKVEFQNSGHTVIVNIKDKQKRPKLLVGQEIYYFEHLHFHWGKNNIEGSEHAINGKKFPLEVHLNL